MHLYVDCPGVGQVARGLRTTSSSTVPMSESHARPDLVRMASQRPRSNGRREEQRANAHALVARDDRAGTGGNDGGKGAGRNRRRGRGEPRIWPAAPAALATLAPTPAAAAAAAAEAAAAVSAAAAAAAAARAAEATAGRFSIVVGSGGRK